MQFTIYFRAYVSLLPGQLYLKCEHDLHQCFERIMTRQARFKTIRFCSVQRYLCIHIVQEHSKHNLAAIILSGIHAWDSQIILRPSPYMVLGGKYPLSIRHWAYIRLHEINTQLELCAQVMIPDRQIMFRMFPG